MNSIFWMTTQHWRQWVQQELLRSQGPHTTQDSDLAFNSTPLPQARRPGLQPWPLTSARVSLGSTPTEGWAMGQQAGSTGGLCMDATLPTPNCHTNDSCCMILEDSFRLNYTLINSSSTKTKNTNWFPSILHHVWLWFVNHIHVDSEQILYLLY